MIFDGVDTNEQSFDGKKASASTSFYNVTLDDGIDTVIEATVYQGQVAGNSENDIAVAMASEIRSKAPIVSLTGSGILLEQQSLLHQMILFHQRMDKQQSFSQVT